MSTYKDIDADARKVYHRLKQSRKRDKRSKAFDKGGVEALKDMKGKPSFVEKLKVAGVFYDICAETRAFKLENPNTSYMDTYHHLAKKFPSWFPEPKPASYGSNFSLFVNSEPTWLSAYYSSRGDLLNKVELRMKRMLDSDRLSDANVIKAYEVINRIEAERANPYYEEDINIEVNFNED